MNPDPYDLLPTDNFDEFWAIVTQPGDGGWDIHEIAALETWAAEMTRLNGVATKRSLKEIIAEMKQISGQD